MTVKLFILGRPGSGKSHAARFFDLRVRMRDASCFRINDYEFLQRQFFFDFKHDRFAPAGNNGFHVRDMTVFDEALFDIKNKLKQCCESKFYDLIIIEFARPNYRSALQQLGKHFLQDAYFLYIHTDLSTCFRRIWLRAAYPKSVDDTFMARDSLDFLYHEDNKHYMLHSLAADLELKHEQIMCIDNIWSVIHFEACLDIFFQRVEDQIGQSIDTDPLQHIPAAIIEYIASK